MISNQRYIVVHSFLHLPPFLYDTFNRKLIFLSLPSIKFSSFPRALIKIRTEYTSTWFLWCPRVKPLRDPIFQRYRLFFSPVICPVFNCLSLYIDPITLLILYCRATISNTPIPLLYNRIFSKGINVAKRASVKIANPANLKVKLGRIISNPAAKNKNLFSQLSSPCSHPPAK